MEGNYYLNRNTRDHDHHHHHNLGFEEHSWGTSWPARNYSCSFCKREFRSAQALGGHMNVHRRDRARLRSSLISSWVNSDQCPNNNNKPNPTPTITTPCSSPLYLSLSSPSPSLPHNTSHDDKKPRLTPPLSLPLLNPQRREIMMSKSIKSYEEVKKHNVLMNNEQNITLELGIGLFKHQEEKLDLELHL